MDAFLLSFGVSSSPSSATRASSWRSRSRHATGRSRCLSRSRSPRSSSTPARSLVGSPFALALPTPLIQVVAGLAFFVFAAWTIRGDELGEADEAARSAPARWALLTIGTAFFLAELGDKTMLATITLATTEEPWGIWLGSTAGMVAADALAIGFGALLGTRLPERAIKVFAAAAFVVFGVVLVAQGLGLT